MTITSEKLATTTAATFAAAFSSLYAAPELQADVVDIVFDRFDSGATFQFQTIAGSLSTIGAGPVFSFFPVPGSDSSGFSAGADSLRANLARVGPGILSAGNFPGTDSFVTFTADETGTAFFGFQLFDENGNVSGDGRVGFFQVDFGTAAGDGVEFVSGQFGSVAGESVTVPAAVPEPASGLALAALALGAAGIRRKRQVA